ncbi:MAG TPA: hypothetical protein VHD95_08980 [Rhizomicrobium sp.]|nr:hypothetical protein [Rhizomicrobium sp.]
MAIGFAAIFAIAPAVAAPHKATPEPIYKVDSVVTTNEEGKLVVTARGAVNSGGWTNPRLRPKASKDAHVMAFEFVAIPPPPDAAVIEALVPIEAKTIAPRPGARISEIRVDAESNDADVRIPGEDGEE